MPELEGGSRLTDGEGPAVRSGTGTSRQILAAPSGPGPGEARVRGLFVHGLFVHGSHGPCDGMEHRLHSSQMGVNATGKVMWREGGMFPRPAPKPGFLLL